MRVRDLLGILLVCLGASSGSGCGTDPTLPAVDLLMEVHGPAKAPHVGEGFDLVVVRQWHRDLQPEAWDERVLAPLRIVSSRRTRVEQGPRIRETHRLRAHAFRLDDVVLRPLSLRARTADGGSRVTRSDRVEIPLRRAVDPTAPDDPEGPGALPEPATSGLPPWMLGLGVLLLGAGVVGLRSWRRSRARSAPPGDPAADWSALRHRLAALPRKDLGALRQVLRDALALHLGPTSRAETTPELRASLRAHEDAAPRPAADLLAALDGVRFSAGRADRPAEDPWAMAQAVLDGWQRARRRP